MKTGSCKVTKWKTHKDKFSKKQKEKAIKKQRDNDIIKRDKRDKEKE